MVYGDGGKFGIVSNVESATCRAGRAVEGSNPTLTASLDQHHRHFFAFPRVVLEHHLFGVPD